MRPEYILLGWSDVRNGDRTVMDRLRRPAAVLLDPEGNLVEIVLVDRSNKVFEEYDLGRSLDEQAYVLVEHVAWPESEIADKRVDRFGWDKVCLPLARDVRNTVEVHRVGVVQEYLRLGSEEELDALILGKFLKVVHEPPLEVRVQPHFRFVQ